MPPIAQASDIRSRVVPGMSVTMARFLFEQAVEQAALARIGPPDDGEREPFPHHLPESETGRQACRFFLERAQPLEHVTFGCHRKIVIREIDPRFEQGDDLEEPLLERTDAARDRARHLAGGHAGLVQSGGVDQVADGLGSRQIEAAVEECTAG